jgi:hypothetical protein
VMCLALSALIELQSLRLEAMNFTYTTTKILKRT